MKKTKVALSGAKEGGNGMRASSPKNRLKRKRSGPILESTKVFSPRPDHKINYSVARPNLNRLPKQIINEDLRKLAEFLVVHVLC